MGDFAGRDRGGRGAPPPRRRRAPRAKLAGFGGAETGCALFFVLREFGEGLLLLRFGAAAFGFTLLLLGFGGHQLAAERFPL